MKTNKLKASVLILLTLLFIGCIQSCSTEESLLENNATIKTVTKEEAIQFLKKHETTVSISDKKATLNFIFGKITQEKLTNTSELLTVVPVIAKAKNQRIRALLLKVENSIETILYNEYPDASSTKNNFNGVILISKLNGDFIRAYRLKNNEYDVELAPAKGNKANKLFSSKDVFAVQELNEVTVINNFKNPHPYVSINELGKELPIADILWYSLGGGNNNEQDPNNLRIFKNLTGKPLCINNLLDDKGNSFVQKLLENFEGDNSDFDINITSVDVLISEKTKKEINGSTTEPIAKTISIKISTTRANEHPNLVVARSILHEYIHADIYRKTPILHDSNGMPDFKKTYETYVDVYHHNNMAELYLNSMKDALKAFHKDVLTSDYKKYKDYYDEEPSDAFYEAVAWGGLAEANPEAWVKLDATKKQEIITLSERIGKLGKISPCAN